MIFLDPYPILLIPDYEGNFVAIAVGFASLKLGKKFWKINTICGKPPSYTPTLQLPSETISPDKGMTSSPITQRKNAIDKNMDRELQLSIEKYNKKLMHLQGKRTVSAIITKQIMKNNSNNLSLGVLTKTNSFLSSRSNINIIRLSSTEASKDEDDLTEISSKEH